MTRWMFLVCMALAASWARCSRACWPAKPWGGVQASLFTQAIGVGAVMAYSLVVTAALLWVINFAMGLRVDAQSEQTGLDIAQHRERLAG